MRTVLLSTGFLLLISCQSSKKEDQKKSAADSLQANTDQYSEALTPSTTENPHAETIGIITSSETDLLSAPSLSEAAVIATLSKGFLVKVLKKSENLVVESLTPRYPCDEYGYHYFRVSAAVDGKDTSGWVYGKYLYQVDNDRQTNLSGGVFSTVTHQNSDYEINFAFSDGVGVSNSEGLTGCEDTYVIFFTSPNNKKAQLVEVSETVLSSNAEMIQRSSDGLLILVASSEGGSCKVINFESSKCDEEPSLVVSTQIGYQDGSGTGLICINDDGNRLIATRVTIERDLAN
jgi:hypothetical protein